MFAEMPAQRGQGRSAQVLVKTPHFDVARPKRRIRESEGCKMLVLKMLPTGDESNLEA